jgi:hypothetical protein
VCLREQQARLAGVGADGPKRSFRTVRGRVLCGRLGPDHRRQLKLRHACARALLVACRSGARARATEWVAFALLGRKSIAAVAWGARAPMQHATAGLWRWFVSSTISCTVAAFKLLSGSKSVMSHSSHVILVIADGRACSCAASLLLERHLCA